LKGFPLKEVVIRTWAEIRSDDVFGRSAQLAYYFFLSLFPFLVFVVASLSVIGTADRGRALLFAFFARFLPGPAFQLISSTFDEILKSGGPLKMSIGILASVWSASLGMGAVMDTLNAAYKVKETRSLLKQYVVAVALTVAIALLLLASVAAAIVVRAIALESSLGYIAGVLWRIGQWPLTFVVLLLALEVIYYFAPDLRDRQWHWITPGAVAGVFFFAVEAFGLRIYLHFSSGYSVTYGSLGAVVILLLCFYFGGMALLSGGVLNAVLAQRGYDPT
jgi:membrane protein